MLTRSARGRSSFPLLGLTETGQDIAKVIGKERR